VAPRLALERPPAALVQRSIPFILDSCESLGARHPGDTPSDYANLVAYSFSFSKPIHAADTGGALSGPSELIERIEKAPEFATWATRMPEINASFLVHAWPDLFHAVEHLNQIYRQYEFDTP
jgi:dTDP-4-amino-4,6-dideoxygalactose transaminase